MFFVIGLGLFALPILFHLALRLRLGIPMLYIVLALTVFHDRTRSNPELADGILFALVGLAALSWVVTAARKLYDVIDGYREERVAAELLAHRVRQARAMGEFAISTEDLWR